MQCDNAREHFSDYLSEDIERALQVTLDNHLSDCSQCREEVEGLRLLWTRLDNAEVIEPPHALHDQIMARVTAERTQSDAVKVSGGLRWDWRRVTEPRSLAFAAAAAIVMFASVEVVQTQRAAIGPLGYVARLFHSAPPAAALQIQGLQGRWIPRAGGGGAVVVHTRVTRSGGDWNSGAVSYHAQVGGVEGATAQGTLTGDQELVLNLPVADDPTGTALPVSILLTPTDGDPVRRDLTIPVSPASRDDRVPPTNDTVPDTDPR